MVVRPLTNRAAKTVQEARSMSTPAARKTTMGVSAMLAMMSMTTCKPSPAASRWGGTSSTAKRMADEPAGRDVFIVTTELPCLDSDVEHPSLLHSLPRNTLLICYRAATRTGQTSPILAHLVATLTCGFLWR